MSIFWKALLLLELGAVGLILVYLLLRYIVVADALRRMLNRSSGDGKKSRFVYGSSGPVVEPEKGDICIQEMRMKAEAKK